VGWQEVLWRGCAIPCSHTRAISIVTLGESMRKILLLITFRLLYGPVRIILALNEQATKQERLKFGSEFSQ